MAPLDTKISMQIQKCFIHYDKCLDYSDTIAKMLQGHCTKSCHISAVNTVQQLAYRLYTPRSCLVFKGCLEEQCFSEMPNTSMML